jgi:hypothetical protein
MSMVMASLGLVSNDADGSVPQATGNLTLRDLMAGRPGSPPACVASTGLPKSRRSAEEFRSDVDYWQRETTIRTHTTSYMEPDMRYACLIYFDPEIVFNRSPEAEAVLRDAGRFDAEIKASGNLVAAHALTLPQAGRTVKVRDGKTSTTDGPFMETKEMLGGIILIEARDLDDAVRIAAQIPFARLGAIEVRPLVDYSQPRPSL